MSTMEIVKRVITEVIECPESDVKADSRITIDLGADSLDVVDLNYSLGKAFNIKMPTKTVIAHGLEICGDEGLLIENDRLTEVGAEFLKQCPNQYSQDQVGVGVPLVDVFENTNVQNWIDLCDAILRSQSGNGDIVIRENAELFLRTVIEATV